MKQIWISAINRPMKSMEWNRLILDSLYSGRPVFTIQGFEYDIQDNEVADQVAWHVLINIFLLLVRTDERMNPATRPLIMHKVDTQLLLGLDKGTLRSINMSSKKKTIFALYVYNKMWEIIVILWFEAQSR